MTQFSFPFGLIGDDLLLKKNIQFKVDAQGRILDLIYEDCGEVESEFLKKNPVHIILPGLINSHVHIGDSFAKEMGYDKNLIDVVAPPNGVKHKLLAHTPSNIKKVGIQKAAQEMISNGITFFSDFRERGLEGINLIKEGLASTPIKSQILGRFREKSEIESIFQNADGIGLSSYKNITSQLKDILKTFKKKYNKLIACHHAEYKRDSLLFNNILNDNIIDVIIHGTQLNDEDLLKLKGSGISLILCPRCNGYFGVGFPPIESIIRNNILITIGTDNMMVNSPDLFEEMRYLYLIFKVLNKSQDLSLTAKSLLEMITVNAARILNIENMIGSIKEGKQADFFTINLNSNNYYCHQINYHNIYPLIVQRTKPENIRQVYINGEKIFERK
ncbi:MAG: amidohydrolase family protein [Promethearchaeati archaeon]